nr:MAG: hypothetical protein [Bacteriophage sp.]
MARIKEEIVKDFGEVTIPEKWEDATLKQYQELQRLVEANADKEEKGIDKYEILSIFIGKTVKEIKEMPMTFVDKLMSRLTFMNEPPKFEPKNELKINQKRYKINYENEMSVGEYEAVMTIINADRFNLAALLAVLCREVVSETYDPMTKKTYVLTEQFSSFFSNVKFDERVKLFENMKLVEALPLITFFFNARSNIETIFSKLFEGGEGSGRQICSAYREFGKQWQFTKMVFQAADNVPSEVMEIRKWYLFDFLTFMTYLIDESVAEEAQRKFIENKNKNKK